MDRKLSASRRASAASLGMSLDVSGAGAPCFILIAPLSSFHHCTTVPQRFRSPGNVFAVVLPLNYFCKLVTELVEVRLCPALSDSKLHKMVALRLCLGWETSLYKWVLTIFPMQIQDQNDRAL